MTRKQINELRRRKYDLQWSGVILVAWIFSMTAIAYFGDPVLGTGSWAIIVIVFAAALGVGTAIITNDWEDYQDLKESYND